MKFDNKWIATTVFSPLEYSSVGIYFFIFLGFSEEEAIKEYSEKKIEVYHSRTVPLEE